MVLHPQGDDMPIFLKKKKILPYMFKLRQNFSQIVMSQNSKLQNYVSSIYLYGKEFVVQECNSYFTILDLKDNLIKY